MKRDTSQLKETYGKRLKEIRLERGISIKEICEATGIPEKRYLKIEHGEVLGAVPEVSEISIFLNVEIQYLVGLTDEMRPLKKITL